jgi:ribosomal protein L7/L12
MELKFKIFGYAVEVITYKKTHVPNDVVDAIVFLIFHEKRIAAIKKMKEHFQVGLKEAKDLVDKVVTIRINDYAEAETIFHMDEKQAKKFFKKKLKNYENV